MTDDEDDDWADEDDEDIAYSSAKVLQFFLENYENKTAIHKWTVVAAKEMIKSIILEPKCDEKSKLIFENYKRVWKIFGIDIDMETNTITYKTYENFTFRFP
jgi:hypothetical protein